jgi:hypothetical protein
MAAPKNHLTGDARFPLRRLYATVTIGASGAVSSTAGYGILSCTEDATGTYKFILDQAYESLVYAHATTLNSTIDDIMTSIKAEDVDATSDPYVTLYTYSVGGAASEPASGSLLYVEIVVQATKT